MMIASPRYLRLLGVLILFGTIPAISYTQCSPAVGPSPTNANFNSGTDASGRILPAPSQDPRWMVTSDSINGPYAPAYVMTGPLPGYYNSLYGAQWISINSQGQQTGPPERLYFFRIIFNLPCSNPCGKDFGAAGAFCLGLNLYADNSIYEIYVNGVPQSPNLGGLIPVVNPFNPAAPAGTAEMPVELCHNWRAGSDTLVIVVASSPPEVALLVEGANEFPPTVSSFQVGNICQGSSYSLGNKVFTQEGYYEDTIHQASGCDSIIVLNLIVKPNILTILRDTVCQGQSFLGYSTSGTYYDTLPAVNGCDSIRTLVLTVSNIPIPQLGADSVLCTGDTLVLNPGTFASYLWQDGSQADHFVVKNEGVYAVTVTNSCGSTKASINIREKNCYVRFPNAFTPNHDGRNDLFRALTAFKFQQYRLTVFNRWGQKVFDTRDQSAGWDGTLHGRMQDAGTYVWICQYGASIGETVTLKGTVVLIR